MGETRFHATAIAISAISLGLCLCPTAQAYIGGPVLIEVLGWHSDSLRVYVQEHPSDDFGTFGNLYYFDFKSADPEKRVRVGWNVPQAKRNDAEQIRRRSELVSHLVPLQVSVARALPLEIAITKVDSLDFNWGRRAKYELTVKYEIGASFEVVSYGPEVVVKDVYKLPDGLGYLYVFVVRGNAGDSLLAETQVPVICRPPYDRVRHVEWDARW